MEYYSSSLNLTPPPDSFCQSGIKAVREAVAVKGVKAPTYSITRVACPWILNVVKTQYGVTVRTFVHA